MNKPVLPLTYEQLDHWIESLQPTLLAERFTMALGILRGGAPLALMVSHAVGVPVAFLRYDRQTRAVAWDSTLPIPPAGSKVLLCEDIAGRGFTLVDCIAFLQTHGLEVKTLTGAVDDLSRAQPDYAIDARGYFALFPWERQAYTERYREDWARVEAGAAPAMASDHEYATYAIDLDGILLPDVPLARYDEDLDAALAERDALLPFEALPGIDPRHVRTIITGRPEMDRARTAAWLTRHGFAHLQLVMRAPGLHDDSPAGAAAHKASAALRAGVTHFVESDPVQALLIAQQAPLLRVIWWDALTRTGMLVSARAWR
ncbi:hypoxanthine phosphoribosyltransferase [Paraburkholderia sp. WC7.3g]|uniref:phosphoribosyltransferase n=1 Tax=Paraburkholderia sp. WC7.3g TaxID=2991070 RepID=UPI003D200073